MRPLISTPLDPRDIKGRLDLAEVARRVTRLRRAGHQRLGLCPLPDHRERHPSFYVDSRRWWCFGCQRGGDLFGFIMAVEGCDFPAALRVAARLLDGGFGGASESAAFFAAGERAGAKPPGFRRKPLLIARKPEPEPRSFARVNRWPSIEECAAERSAYAARVSLLEKAK